MPDDELVDEGTLIDRSKAPAVQLGDDVLWWPEGTPPGMGPSVAKVSAVVVGSELVIGIVVQRSTGSPDDEGDVFEEHHAGVVWRHDGAVSNGTGLWDVTPGE